jgi:hypothetical protein
MDSPRFMHTCAALMGI